MDDHDQSAGSRVTSSVLAANLRVLSVRVDGVVLGAQAHDGLLARVDQIVALYLEKHWPSPRRFAPVRPLSYLLLPGPDDADFGEDVDAVTAQLERHLYGEGVEVSCLIGSAGEVEALASQPEEEFRAAQAAVAEADAESEPAGAEGPKAARVRAVGDPAEAWRRQLRLFAGYDTPRNAVLCYVAALGRGDYPAAPASYEDSAQLAQGEIEILEHAALAFAAEKIADKLSTGAVCYCLTPLSYETLADRRRRDAYLAAGADAPEEVRRFILPSVFGGPLRPSSGFLMEIVGALRRSFSYVDWQASSCTIDLEPLKHAHIFSATLALPQHSGERKIELARLASFVRQLGLMRIRSGVSGLATPAEVKAAIEAGAHYLSGPAISTEMPELSPRVQLLPDALPLVA